MKNHQLKFNIILNCVVISTAIVTCSVLSSYIHHVKTTLPSAPKANFNNNNIAAVINYSPNAVLSNANSGNWSYNYHLLKTNSKFINITHFGVYNFTSKKINVLYCVHSNHFNNSTVALYKNAHTWTNVYNHSSLAVKLNWFAAVFYHYLNDIYWQDQSFQIQQIVLYKTNYSFIYNIKIYSNITRFNITSSFNWIIYNLSFLPTCHIVNHLTYNHLFIVGVNKVSFQDGSNPVISYSTTKNAFSYWINDYELSSLSFNIF